VTKAELKKGELDMAKRLVEDMSGDWSPDDYVDQFEAKIRALVDRKASEGKIEAVETIEDTGGRHSADVIDLTELLKRSLAGKGASKPATKDKQEAAAKPAKPAKPRAARKPRKAS
jgi:DNA end-binding protein Ku